MYLQAAFSGHVINCQECHTQHKSFMWGKKKKDMLWFAKLVTGSCVYDARILHKVMESNITNKRTSTNMYRLIYWLLTRECFGFSVILHLIEDNGWHTIVIPVLKCIHVIHYVALFGMKQNQNCTSSSQEVTVSLNNHNTNCDVNHIWIRNLTLAQSIFWQPFGSKPCVFKYIWLKLKQRAKNHS